MSEAETIDPFKAAVDNFEPDSVVFVIAGVTKTGDIAVAYQGNEYQLTTLQELIDKSLKHQE